jgi:hypothetical protein
MRRFTPAVVLFTVSAVLLLACDRSEAQKDQWGNIKGKIVWGGEKLPEPVWITPTVNADHCLQANKTAKDGKILDESKLVNKDNKGLKNVFVYILVTGDEQIPIHPKLKEVSKQPVSIDQPACAFFPRALALREGQVFEVKNTAPVMHNIRWIGDGTNNQGGNVTIKPGDKAEVKDLKAQKLPLPLECNIHGWMKGRLLVCNHPYFAITDENGDFEIKDVPVGNYKFMIYHEDIGYRLGAKGKNGEEKTIKAGDNDWGKLEMGK